MALPHYDAPDDLCWVVCPRCRTELPDADLTEIRYFYDRDTGYDLACPICGALVHWEIRITAEPPSRRGKDDGTIYMRSRRP